MGAYVTIPDMAPLEDILVEEITQYENGKCELRHFSGPPCSVVVVGVMAAKCSPMTQMACASGVARSDETLRLCEATGTPCPCGRAAADCWSVVMLP